MNNTTQLNIDEILANLSDKSFGTTNVGVAHSFVDEAKAQLATTIEQYFAEVIGEDGNENLMGGVKSKALDSQMRLTVKVRNELRAEQRQRAAAIVKGVRGE